MPLTFVPSRQAGSRHAGILTSLDSAVPLVDKDKGTSAYPARCSALPLGFGDAESYLKGLERIREEFKSDLIGVATTPIAHVHGGK
jgi:hypothetical protein